MEENQKNREAEPESVTDTKGTRPESAAETEDHSETQTVSKPRGGLAGWIDSVNSRSAIVMLIAGAYLAYLGWGLCKGYLDGAEGSGIGFFCAGAAFILIGVFMVFVGGKVTIKAQNEKKQEEAENKNTGAPEEVPAEKKTMSIAERAALASRSEEELEVQDPDTEQQSNTPQ